MAPKPARKFTQGVSGSATMLPATAPTMISISATEIATRIETIEATSASPIQSADASQTLSIEPPPCRAPRGTPAAVMSSMLEEANSLALPHADAVGVISPPKGHFWGTPSPYSQPGSNKAPKAGIQPSSEGGVSLTIS